MRGRLSLAFRIFRFVPFLRLLLFIFVLLCLTGCLSKTGKPDLLLFPPSLPSGTVGEPYHADIKPLFARSPIGSIHLAEGSLPDGLVLIMDDAVGEAIISGTPQVEGVNNFIIEAWCYGTQVSGQRTSREYSVRIVK